MKKIIGLIIGISLLATPIVSFAQTTNSSSYNASLLQLIALLTQELLSLEAQLAKQQSSTPTSTHVIPNQTTAQPAAIDAWSTYPRTSFNSFANAPSSYTDAEIEIKGEVGQFLPYGGSGGTHNYIGIVDPNAQTNAPAMIEIDNNTDYLAAVNAVLKDDLIAAYGTGIGTQQFVMNGQTLRIPVLDVQRLDDVGGCDAFGCLVSSDTVIFPAGATPLTTPQNSMSSSLAAPSTPAATEQTSLATPTPSRYFQFSTTGTCDNNGNGEIMLSGYPYTNGYEVPTNDINTWGGGEIAFTIPTSVLAGTYQVSFRGYDAGIGFYYCTGGGAISL